MLVETGETGSPAVAGPLEEPATFLLNSNATTIRSAEADRRDGLAAIEAEEDANRASDDADLDEDDEDDDDGLGDKALHDDDDALLDDDDDPLLDDDDE